MEVDHNVPRVTASGDAIEDRDLPVAGRRRVAGLEE